MQVDDLHLLGQRRASGQKQREQHERSRKTAVWDPAGGCRHVAAEKSLRFGHDRAMDEGVRTILLETARLRLRRFAPDDVDRLVELDSDPEVMRFITYGVVTPRATYEQVILPRWFAIYARTPQLGYWAAEDRQTGDFLGWFHLRPDRFDEGELELGYRLARAAWGRGLATEGALAVLDHGFTRAAAGKVTARTMAANQRSRRVMQKCGLEFECDFVYPEDVLQGRDETERAAVKYSITRPAWLAQRA
jgi:RimJ/RimL family protein N-acetyltransferase